MKVAVVGSRSFNDYAQLKLELDSLHQVKKISLIVSGGAVGADSLAERWAKENQVETLIFLPDWAKYGKPAAVVRNRLIIEASEECIAFWNGTGRGTKSSIDLAKKKGIPLKIVLF